ncbi:Long Arms of the Bivalent protein [Caenorhabditis elegans]|uniref:Long Arms of the Bivalent protein n=1 Tax=Caenorhabditis elegans TaxID=6239 RepID=Q8WQE8_CAEEL|nr:Long Arms of the Bivalent protein [Caenorhabditis elegans]CCD61835.1 Long Arms of the Bivalent protein [Caenorhabditis elegans]|eukprot:NP_741221.1 Uncharacterized protein CELE_F56C9.11 [Caenorhabditis elegans]
MPPHPSTTWKDYMLDNLKIEGETLKRASEEQVINTVVDVLRDIGFNLPNLKIVVQKFGYMPDDDSEVDQRYYVCFEVDSNSSAEMFEQRHGKTKKIHRMNKKSSEMDHKKWLKLKQYIGFNAEIIQKTLREAKRIMSEHPYPSSDGFRLTCNRNMIVLYFDDKKESTINIEQLARNYRKVFDKAIESLSEQARNTINRLILMEPNTQKRGISDETVSNASPPEKSPRLVNSPMPAMNQLLSPILPN